MLNEGLWINQISLNSEVQGVAQEEMYFNIFHQEETLFQTLLTQEKNY